MNGVQRAVRRGGVRVAQVDRFPGGHLALVRTIERLLPRLFDASAAAGLDAVFALQINHPRGRAPDTLGLAVRQGRLTVARGAPAQAGATVSVGADDMVRLATGDTGWPELLASGRLVLNGDPFLALRFPQLFGLPAEPGTPLILRRRERER